MPQQIALLLCILVTTYLFWIDRQKNEGVSNAIWIPFIWMFFAGSRELSLWLDLRAPGNITDGQPYDRAVYTILIILAIIVLKKRRIDWNKLFIKNIWVWLYFIYGAISILWSDYPLVSSKRWIKGLGNVFLAVVILTEERPYDALGVIMRRLSFLFLPFSILFIKYYPALGRQYHNFSGAVMYCGVACQKNGLGQICLLSGIYYSWMLFIYQKIKPELSRKLHFSIYLILIPMLIWLLYMANSATSWACLVIAICLFIVAQLPIMVRNPKKIIYFFISCIVLYTIFNTIFDIKGAIITMLGRKPDLTTRIPMWDELLTMVKNPIIGFGYESFWIGARRKIIFDHWGVDGQAHNGYLEVYLNIGLIGLCIVIYWFITGLKKIDSYLIINYKAAIIKLCLLIVIAMYSWTEAVFFGVNNMWLLLFFAIIDITFIHEPEEYKKTI